MAEVAVLDFQTRLAEAIPDATQAFIRLADPFPAEVRVQYGRTRVRIEDEIMLITDLTDVTPDATGGWFEYPVIRNGGWECDYTVPQAHTLNGDDGQPRPVDAVVTPGGIERFSTRFGPVRPIPFDAGFMYAPHPNSGSNVSKPIGDCRGMFFTPMRSGKINRWSIFVFSAGSADSVFHVFIAEYVKRTTGLLLGALTADLGTVSTATTGTKTVVGLDPPPLEAGKTYLLAGGFKGTTAPSLRGGGYPGPDVFTAYPDIHVGVAYAFSTGAAFGGSPAAPTYLTGSPPADLSTLTLSAGDLGYTIGVRMDN